MLGLATGYGLDANILDAYNFLVERYEPGDKIFLFGFSRGAYTVRRLRASCVSSGSSQRRRATSPTTH